jgi:hypothetical protein
MIWADKIPLILWAIFSAFVLTCFTALGGAADGSTNSQVIGYFGFYVAGPMWILFRVLDFICTGRLRG